jgi:hypothetical protein
VTLKVVPDSVAGYGKLLDKLGEHAYDVSRYAGDASFDALGTFDHGLLSMLSYTNSETAKKVKAVATNVGELLGKCGRQFSDAAYRYEKMDLKASADLSKIEYDVRTPEEQRQDLLEFDAQLPKAARPPSERLPEAGGKTFEVERDPKRHLIEPQPIVEDDPSKILSSKIDWLSPAHYVNLLVKKVTGFDFIKETSEFFGGDWKGWAKTADVWRRCGWAYTDIAHGVWKGNVHLDEDWQGNASDAAYAYHHKLAFLIKDLQKPMSKLSEVYRLAAIHANTAASVVADYTKQLIDTAIILLAGRGAGPLATVVQAPMFKRLWNIVSNIQGVFIAARAFIGGLNGMASTALALLTDIEKKLPKPYFLQV